jgi:methionyl-tRNA formyltransferase
MSEQIDELEVLRRTNAELLKKSADRKARILELEASTAELTTKLTTADTVIHEMTVGAPLKRMAESVSPVPEIWLAEFAKHFKVELKDGKLAVLTLTGEPATNKKGESVEFTNAGIVGLVANSDKDELKAFNVITIVSKASGGGATGSTGSGNFPTETKPTAAKPTVHFGLR